MQGAMVQANFQEGLGLFGGDPTSGMQAAMPSAAGVQKAGGKSKKVDDDEKYTTVMLRNIPNKYTRGMLIEQLHRTGFKGDIDYLYLPTDFANRCNVGYCFLNFRTPQARARFMQAFDGVAAQSCLPGFNSYKVCQVTRAKWQGREENVRRLRSGPELMTQLAAHPEWLPLLMDEEGNQEPFLVDEPGAPPLDPSAPKRQNRRNKGPALDAAGTLEAWMMGMGGMGGMDMGMTQGGGVGRGRGMRGRGHKGGKGGGDFDLGASAYGGFPMTAMPVPVMTEQGVQYVPYEAAYGGMAMPQQQMFGMYGGYQGFPSYYGMDGGAEAESFQMPRTRQPRNQLAETFAQQPVHPGKGRGKGVGGKGAMSSGGLGEPAQINITPGLFAED